MRDSRNEEIRRRKRIVTGTLRPLLPYVKGVSKALRQVFHCHGVVMAMKPHLTLKRMLVHSKDKRTPQKNAGVVYQVPCKDCPCEYTGETERRYGVREKEHQRDMRSSGREIFRGGKVHTGKKEELGH